MSKLRLKAVTVIMIVTCFLFTRLIFAQPENVFVSYINHGEDNSVEIFDIYDAGNHYVLAGGVEFSEMDDDTYAFWLVGVSLNGEMIWDETYQPDEDADVNCSAHTVIQTDDGGYVLGGRRGGYYFSILKLNAEREVEWWNRYGEEQEVRPCYSVIELKSGDLLAASNYREGGEQYGYVVKLDIDGEIIWERSYEQSYPKSIRETEGGYVIGGGNSMIKIDPDGELLWHGDYDLMGGEVISCREGGFAMCGTRFPRNHEDEPRFRLLRVDDEGRQTWLGDYNGENNGLRHENMASLTQMPDGGFMMVGGRGGRDRESTILRTDSQGNEQWRRDDTWGINFNYYTSVVLGNDGIAVAAGGCQRAGRNPEGVVVKLVPVVFGPIIVAHHPETLEFSVLPGDSIHFALEAYDMQDDSLRYIWTVGDDSVSVADSVQIFFDELGDVVVKCVVSDGELADSVMWLVHSEEWYIDRHTPDSLAWAIRRPRDVDFNLGVRAIEGVEPQYRWILTGHRGAWEEVGDAPNLTYEFDRPGEYSLEGRAIHEGEVRSVTWRINVNSVLYWWTPHDRELTVHQNEEIDFTVIPYNPEPDSLHFRWLVDRVINENENEAGISRSFARLGDHSVSAFVREGEEADTVEWSITVEDPNALEDSKDGLLPTEVTLYPAAPNPFNSTTRVRYFLPRSADVRLTVYDSAGRLIQILSEDWTVAGEHHATLHGSEFPAGVYLLRLDTGSVVRSMKVVLLK